MQPEPPPRPTLDALETADFVEEHRALEENERVVDAIWVQLNAAFREHDARVEASYTSAFAKDPPTRTDTQAHSRLTRNSWTQLRQLIGQLYGAWREAGPGREQMALRAADVLAHRPAAMALFTHADAPLEVPVGTPTNGRALTDEMVLVREFGLNFTG